MTTKKSTADSPKTLAEALAIFQSQVKSADRTGIAKETRKDKKTNKSVTTERKYSTLEDVLKALQPATELGISHTQTFDYLPLEDGKVLTICITTLYFKEEKLESKLPLKELRGYNIMHDLGIAITYTRRYALGAAYGIGSEVDDDAMSLTEPPADKTGITRTPTKPKQEPDPVESIEDKNYGNPIAKPVLDVLVKKIMKLSENYPDKKDEVINKYKKEYKITAEKIGPADIRTAEQGKFLTLLINEIDSSL
tara:strand:+ start:2198 stop:2953 length:756 start_codon:yes stop_codon:yes gene_type:complete